MDMRPGVLSIEAGEDCVKERLDLFVARHVRELSRSRIQKLIADGFVLLNDGPAVKKHLVTRGDCVTIDRSQVSAIDTSSLIPQEIPLVILYEDEFLLAVNKPAGMVVHPGNGNRDGTLVHALLYYVKNLSGGFCPDRPGIVHRLDKDTSGVVLVAKTDETHHKLAGLFSSREIKKQYLGICVGPRMVERGSISAPLGRSRRDPLRRAVREGGKESLTEYRLVAHRCGVSIIEFTPRTGRTHQIRVHANTAGFPILADQLYGGGTDSILRLPVLDRPFAHKVYKCFSRHALHARSITFVHPHTHKEQSISAPLPMDFTTAMKLFESAL
jgi:23S rRNA pseudouridine1911/1915/1917 synthase